MPSDLTHYTFVKENVPDSKYFSLTALAGQGPDVFFFYGYNLKKRKNASQVRHFGTLLHHTNIAPLYAHMCEYATASVNKEILLAFLRGLFMHYILDRNCHPYIFYRTGFTDDPNKKKYFSYHHVWFESILDFSFSKKHETYRSSVKNLRTEKEYVKEVSKMFYDLSLFMKYEGLSEDSYYLGYKDMKFAKKLLFSRFGIKKGLFNLFFKNNVGNALAMPSSDKKYLQYDILNDSHALWKNPVSGEESNESFEDLFLKAKKELSSLGDIFVAVNNGGDYTKMIDEFVHKVDHDGCIDGAKKKYFKMYFEKEEKVVD